MFSDWIGGNKSVLDLGGRDGNLTKYFIDNNNVTIGDIDGAALQYAKETYRVKTEITNLNEKLPFSDNTFDVVVMAEVLEHLPYPKIPAHFYFASLRKNQRVQSLCVKI